MKTIAVLAFGGGLPKAIIQSLTHQGIVPLVIGFQEFPADVPCHFTFSVGQVGRLLSCLKRHNIKKILLSGYLHRPHFWKIRFDFQGLRTFWRYRHFAKKGDDTLLRFIVSQFEKNHMYVASIHSACPDLVISKGALTPVVPFKEQYNSLAKGQKILSLLSPEDIGQSLAIASDVILAIESLEGTDLMIERVGCIPKQRLSALPKPIFIKASKITQTDKADLPVFGMKTLDNLLENGFAGAFLEANKVLLIEGDKMIQKAKENNFFLCGF